jgi:hypothetical protein
MTGRAALSRIGNRQRSPKSPVGNSRLAVEQLEFLQFLQIGSVSHITATSHVQRLLPPLCAISGPSAMQQKANYSITSSAMACSVNSMEVRRGRRLSAVGV